MPKQPPNRMVVSSKFYQWLENHQLLPAFNTLKLLQDRYMQESDTRNHGYRSVSTERLQVFLQKYEGRQANIREELRRRGA